jgi:hypothetical protein
MTLADIVRDKVQSGVLPRENPRGAVRMNGSGQCCSACELAIVPAETQLAFDLPDRGAFRFHVACWAVWLATLVSLGPSGAVC